MPEHGHDVCPHCDTDLEGAEATCPSCSGPLFGIAPKQTSSTPDDTPSGTTTIDNVEVPTYTPPATEVDVATPPTPLQQEIPDESHEMTSEDYVQRGEMLGIEGRHAEALRLFNQAISLDPTNHMAWFNRGVMSETTGDVQDAIKAFQIALDNCPGHGAASANLAVLLQRLGHPSDAVEHAQNGLIAFPGHPALLDIVNSAGAEVPVTPIVAHEPEDEPEEEEVEVREDEPEQTWAEPLGAVKALDSHPAATEQEIVHEQASSPNPIDLDALAESATAMIRSGDPASALESLRPHLPESAAEHTPSWRAAAGAMARLDLIDAAINAFEYALDLDSNDASTWFNLGALRRRNGDLASALKCFEKAVDLDQNYSKAANALAQSAMKLGEIETAMKGFRTLLSIEPSHESGVTFAELLIDIAEGEGRVLELDATLPRTLPAGPEMAQEALRHLPENELALRARALSIAGEHAESVTLWKGLLETNKEDPNLWLGLARSLSAAGSEDKAAACREKARALGAEVSEPVVEIAVHSEPQVESNNAEEIVENSDSQSMDEGDPWAAFDEDESEEEVPQTPQITTEEIVEHEAALDTVQEPEPVTYEPVSEEVDLAAAALEAQAGIMSEYEVKADSSSVANQDIEWYNKGIELLNKDRYREALSCFDRALPSFKDDKAMAIKILNGRGNCFYYLNEYKDAIENYFKAFGIDKGLTKGSALYNMGTSYAELESYDNAIHCFNQSFGKDVGEPLSGENKKRAKEQIRRCKILLKEQKKNAA
ncbi:MAG: tetratricopeptide repeat protein [Candidatus Thermoplasmatota archaeon]|nr:tetratricopeptide repeat protein [Candidatus Thermoplasmatota archaeon]